MPEPTKTRRVLPPCPMRDDPEMRNPLGASGTLGTIFGKPEEDEELRRYEDTQTGTQFGVSAPAPAPNPAPAPAPNPAPAPAPAQAPAGILSEEEEKVFKALSGLFGAIVTKWADPRNPALTVAMRKEFDDAIKQVFQPKGGSDNFTNLHSPGMAPAKDTAQPGQSGSSTGQAGSGKETYPTGTYPGGAGGYTNPTSPHAQSLDYAGNPQIHLPRTSGNSGYGASKPERSPELRATNPYHSQRGAETPAHPDTSPGQSGIAKAAFQLGGAFQKTSKLTFGTSRHGEGQQENFLDKSVLMKDSYDNPAEAGTQQVYGEDGRAETLVESDTVALRKAINTRIARDSPFKSEADGPEGTAFSADQVTELMKQAWGNPAAQEFIEKAIVIKLGKKFNQGVINPSDE